MSNEIKKKIILTLLGFSFVLFGLIGFVSNSFQGMSSKLEKFYIQHPLNDKNGLVIDSNNNIYVGETQTGSIQVYNSEGNFEYGFSFPTGGAGWFTFGIDNDKIHVITARTDSYFIFENGDLISQTKEFNSKELQYKYKMNRNNYFEKDDKIYTINFMSTVSIKDKANDKIEKINLNTPFWPFSIVFFWLIGAMGMVIIFFTHRKLFASMNNWKK